MKHTVPSAKRTKHPLGISRVQESALAIRTDAGPEPVLPAAHQAAHPGTGHDKGQPRYEARTKPLAGERQLFVQGRDGDFKLDLTGIGVQLHEDSFAFQMPDESLRGVNIRKGDIAIIEPFRWHLTEGDIVMVNINGDPTLRRITFCGKLMYLRADDNNFSPLLPGWEYPYSGMATAILRIAKRGELIRHAVEAPFTKKKSARRPPGGSGVSTLWSGNESKRLRDEPAGPWGSDHV